MVRCWDLPINKYILPVERTMQVTSMRICSSDYQLENGDNSELTSLWLQLRINNRAGLTRPTMHLNQEDLYRAHLPSSFVPVIIGNYFKHLLMYEDGLKSIDTDSFFIIYFYDVIG